MKSSRQSPYPEAAAYYAKFGPINPGVSKFAATNGLLPELMERLKQAVDENKPLSKEDWNSFAGELQNICMSADLAGESRPASF